MKAVLDEFDKWIKSTVSVEVPLTEHKFSPGVLRFVSKYYENEVADLEKVFYLAINKDILVFKGIRQIFANIFS